MFTKGFELLRRQSILEGKELPKGTPLAAVREFFVTNGYRINDDPLIEVIPSTATSVHLTFTPGTDRLFGNHQFHTFGFPVDVSHGTTLGQVKLEFENIGYSLQYKETFGVNPVEEMKTFEIRRPSTRRVTFKVTKKVPALNL